MNLGKKLLLVAGGLAAGLLLAEMGLQLASRLLPSRMDVLRRARAPIAISDPRLGTRPNPDFWDHDADGFRNAGIPDEAFVVALGDSQTYGIGVRRSENWPHQLQRQIGRTVYGISSSGWGPTQSLLLIDRALALRPRLVVEALYTGNDLFDSFETVYYDHQLRELATADPAAAEAIRAAEKEEPLVQRYRRLYELVLGGGPTPVNDSTAAPRRRSLRDVLREHSKLYRLASIIRQAWTANGPEDWESRKREARTGPGKNFYTIFERDGFRTIFTPTYRSGAMDFEDPRLAEGNRITKEVLALLNERTTAAGARFVVLLIPTKELAFRDAAAEVLAGDREYGRLIEREQLVRAGTMDFLRGRSVSFVDALPALRECITRRVQPYRESADGHPNPAGHRVLAGVVAAAMERLGLDAGRPR